MSDRNAVEKDFLNKIKNFEHGEDRDEHIANIINGILSPIDIEREKDYCQSIESLDNFRVTLEKQIEKTQTNFEISCREAEKKVKELNGQISFRIYGDKSDGLTLSNLKSLLFKLSKDLKKLSNIVDEDESVRKVFYLLSDRERISNHIRLAELEREWRHILQKIQDCTESEEFDDIEVMVNRLEAIISEFHKLMAPKQSLNCKKEKIIEEKEKSLKSLKAEIIEKLKKTSTLFTTT